jgi:hypothetical protein
MGRMRTDLTNRSMSYKSAWVDDQLVWDMGQAMNIANPHLRKTIDQSILVGSKF